MGFSKVAAPSGIAMVAPLAPAAAPGPVSVPPSQNNPAPKTSYADEKAKSVKGQVAMHAIIAGYEVASRLAPTMAAKPDDVKVTLHSLALEIAKEIEVYSFHE